MKNFYLFLLSFCIVILSSVSNKVNAQVPPPAKEDTLRSISIRDTTGIPGDTISVPFIGRNFTNVGSIGLYINYDTTALRFLDFKNFYPKLSSIYNESEGVIMFSWTTIFNALSFQQAKMFDVRFVYLGGNTTISIDSLKSSISDFDSMEEVNVNYAAGQVFQCIEPFPVASINFVGLTTFCSGDSLILSTDKLANFNYQWVKDNQPISGATKSTFIVYKGGNYQLEVSNLYNCSTISNKVAVTVSPIPSVKTVNAVPVCGSGSVNLNASATDGKIYWYTSNSGGIPAGLGSTYTTPVITTSKTYYVQAASKDCSSPSRIAVVATVYPVPTATLTSSGASSICAGSSLQLNSNYGQGLTYQWQKNNSVISGATSTQFSILNSQFTDAGTYVVIVTNVNNCSSISDKISVVVNKLPFVSIVAGGPTTFCQGGNFTLSASQSTGLSFQWYKDNISITGKTSSQFSILNSQLTDAGDYTLNVTDINKCQSISNDINIALNSLPESTINSAGPTTVCTGNNVQLSANSSPSQTYQWLKDGNYIIGATSSALTALQTGSYNALITNSHQCYKLSNNIQVTVNYVPIPSLSTQGATTFCQGSSVTIKANTGNGLKYSWQKDNVIIAGETNSSYVANTLGNYSVIETNTYNCSATSNNITVTVNPLPLSTITGPSLLCSGQNITLSANNTDGFGYQWTRNSVNISGATSYNYSPKGNGTYSAVITSDTKCTSVSNSIPVVFLNSPTASITASGTTTICQSGSLSLIANTGNGLAYQWYNSNGIISGATSSQLSIINSQLSDNGNYYSIVSNGNCYKTSNVIALTVNALPSVNLGLDKTIQYKDSIILDAGSGYSSYLWNDNSTGRTLTVRASKLTSGTYTYSVIVTNSSNCSGNSHINIAVNPQLEFTVGGYIKYDNKNATPLSNVKVRLFNKELKKIDSAITNASGYFLFSKVVKGTYTINTVITTKWGGVDPIDAMLINRYFVKLATFSDAIRKQAADVNKDGKQNSVDALLINRRFVKAISSFGAGNWICNPVTFTVNSSNMTENLTAICVGDANGSYTFSKKIESDVNIVESTDSLNVPLGSESIEIPFSVTKDMAIGAMGLVIDIPAQFTINNISAINFQSLKSDLPGVIYNISDDKQEINIAWSGSEIPYSIKSGNSLFSLMLNLNSDQVSNINNQLFDMTTNSVIADIDANNYTDVNLSIPQLNFKNSTSNITNLDMPVKTYLNQNFPNPFANFTTISYSLPAVANVNLSIYNITGQKLMEVVNSVQTKGDYNINSDFSALASGLYIYKLESTKTSSPITEQKLMMIAK